MRTALFIGPSVPPDEVRSRFEGEILPPIKRGDLGALLDRPEPPQHIGIVDGQFLHELSIAPKEVLRTMHSGVRVYGSSSMGALRAVECAPYGMVGIGRIFSMYNSGEIDADDEVAITYSTETLEAMSEPMVNIRIALQAAVDAGVVKPEVTASVDELAKAMYFPDRNYRNLRAASKSILNPSEHEALFEFLGGPTAPDQKRLDALDLIATMNAAVDGGGGGNNASFDRLPDLGAQKGSTVA